MTDYLAAILERKRDENRRRRRHAGSRGDVPRVPAPDRGERAVVSLRRRDGDPPAVLAEVKFRSPSAGQIREARPGEGVRVAQAYEQGGAAVVSVLADGPGFGGSPLLVRRVAEAVDVPVLYKGFVLDRVQVELAFDVGASLVLLLVRALAEDVLRDFVSAIRSLGMEPIVEAANAAEVDVAVAAGATIVGVNARDLQTFRVDKEAAALAVSRIPEDCIAVFMSGVKSEQDFAEVARGRADAVLIGEGLMRAADPGARLAELLRSV